jgi:selenocysteine lyase/cysteine desulfurase
VLDRLETRHKITATESSWDATAGRTHVRLSVSILNTDDDIDRALAGVQECAAAL